MSPSAWMGFPPGPSKPGMFKRSFSVIRSRNPKLPSLKPTECPHKAWALFSAWERPSRDILSTSLLILTECEYRSHPRSL